MKVAVLGDPGAQVANFIRAAGLRRAPTPLSGGWRGQPATTLPSLTLTATGASGDAAGPLMTAPVSALYFEPWHGQWSSAPLGATGQPLWVQIALKATALPAVGCAMMIGLPAASFAETAPPTGTAESSASAAPPAPPAAELEGAAAELDGAASEDEGADAELDGAASEDVGASAEVELAAALEVAAGVLAVVLDPQAARVSAPAPTPAARSTWRRDGAWWISFSATVLGWAGAEAAAGRAGASGAVVMSAERRPTANGSAKRCS